jgi:small subunit ribosomal protein S8
MHGAFKITRNTIKKAINFGGIFMGSLSDPIADLLTRVRNASTARHRFVEVSWSRLKEDIVRVLKEQGYVAHYLIKEEHKKKNMRIFLKYSTGRKPVIASLKRVSKPSLRQYVSYRNLPKVLGGMGITILSTSQGIMVGSQAYEKKVGGELLCVAW